MSLSAALQTAGNSLRTTAAQTAVVARNVAGQSDPSYSRKIAHVTTAGLGPQSVTVARAADAALFEKMTATTSRAAGQQALADGLEALAATIGDPELDRSPAALIGALADSLQLYAVSPGNLNLAQDALTGARDLVAALNGATDIVQGVRAQADSDMADATDGLNDLLRHFEAANNAVVNGTRAGLDVSDRLDGRDSLLARIAETIGVHAVNRGDNDIVLYTDSGVTLFETAPRSVTMQPTETYAANATAHAVFVDGVPVTGDQAAMPMKSGRLHGLAILRDASAPGLQAQLDEIARGLIATFAESDLGGGALPDAPGLFTFPGAPSLPAGAQLAGLAGQIRVAATVDPSQGGDVTLLRDGGISDPGNPSVTANTSGAAGFPGRLNDLIDKLRATQSFDPAAGLGASRTLAGYAADSAGWLEGLRSDAGGASQYQTTLLQHTSQALSNATGVNLDDEMSIMLGLEKTCQASSKLLAAIDALLAAFMAEIG